MYSRQYDNITTVSWWTRIRKSVITLRRIFAKQSPNYSKRKFPTLQYALGALSPEHILTPGNREALGPRGPTSPGAP